MVKLTDEERTQLQELTDGGDARVRRIKRVQILLAVQQGHCDAVIVDTVGVDPSTVYRTKRRIVELVDVHSLDAETVRVVLDNLSAHKPGAMYEVFTP